MKKNLFVSALILSLVSSLVACTTPEPVSSEVESEVTSAEVVSEETVESSSEEPSSEAPSEEESEEVSEEASTEIEEAFSEVTMDNVEMTVKYQVVLKKSPSFKGEKTDITLEKDEKVTVIGLVNDQWYHVKKDDAEGFVNKSYLSEEVVPEFVVTDMTATKYAKQKCNLRTGPGTEYDKAGSLKLNDEVKVTGKTDNNWFRIDYNGSEAYVSASLLVDNKVETPAPSSNGGNGSGNGGGNSQPPVTTSPGSGNNGGWKDEDDLGFDCPAENTCYAEPGILAYVNEYRRAAGVAEVTWNSSEEENCKARARAMKDNGKLDHSIGGGAPHPENLTHFMVVIGDDSARFAANAYANSEKHYGAMITGQYTSICSATCIGKSGKAYNVLWFFV